MLGYLDPGSGSIIVQAVVGGVAGAVVAFKMFGRRIFDVLFFWRSSSPTAEAELDPDAEGVTQQS